MKTKNFVLTDKQRKKSNVKGTGIQYLPGHKDDFIDLCTNVICKSENNKVKVLDIGGGGLRFASGILECDNIEKIFIVDPDYYSLDYEKIFSMAELDSKHYKLFEKKCLLFKCDISTFLNILSSKIKFNYISCFRVFHFVSLATFEKSAKEISRLLELDGRLFISGISFQDNKYKNRPNHLFMNSSPIRGNKNFRKLNSKNPDVRRQMKEQNLKTRMLFFDCGFLDSIFVKYGLCREGSEYPSTRIVNGYVYKKVSSNGL